MKLDFTILRMIIKAASLLLMLLFSLLTFAQTDSLDIYELNLNELSKLKITSASKVTQSISEIPATVHIITASQIKENGYFTLEEALSDLPGLQYRNILGFNSYVFQRGVPNQNNLILVLIDGVQINELNSGGFYGGGQYNLSNVERIEVIYGPTSVVYGTNAVTGIINIITKSALEEKGGVRILAGNHKTSESDVNYCYVNKKKDIGLLASGMIKMSDKADLKGQAGDNNWTDLMDNFENDYSFDIKAQVKDFIIGTNYLFKQSATATSVKSVGTIYRDYGTSWNIQFINNYIKYNKKISDKLNYSSVVYNRNATVLGNTVYYVLDTAQVGYYRPNNLTGFENILNINAGKFFSVTSGVTLEYEWLSEKCSYSYSDSINQRPPTPSKPVILDNYLASVFVEPRLTLFKDLFFSGGLRFDQSSIYDQVLTPRAGLAYHIRNHTIRCSYAEAFRAPKPWDYTDGLGNSSLLPEKITSLEASYGLSLNNHFRVSITAYKNNLINAITKEIDSTRYRWVNKGEINTNGAEFCFNYFSKRISSFINYTYNESFYTNGDFVPEISNHTGNAGITFSFNKFIKLNLRANYIGKRENPKLISATNSKYIDPCLIFNGALTLYNLRGFTVQMSVKNILDTEYYHTSNRDPERYRQPQRTVHISLGYEINKSK